MPTDEVAVCNAALVRIGHSEFISARADATEEAEKCDKLFDLCRDELLELVDWPFARRRLQPAALDATTLDLGAVPTGWTYAYPFPANCIAIRRIYPGVRNPTTDQETPFAIESDAQTGALIVLTDGVRPELIFTARQDNPARWPATFASALSWRLAVDLAVALRKDANWLKIAAQGYAAALGQAHAAAKQSERPDPEPSPSWIQNR